MTKTELLIVSVKIFKMDDESVCHSSIYASFLDDSPVRHPPGKVLNTLYSYQDNFFFTNIASL